MALVSRSMLWSVVAIALAAGIAPAEAQATPLRGDLSIGGKTPVDPPPGEPNDSHAYMTITGPAALRMYRTMKGPERADECRGGKMREAGPLSCTLAKEGRSATCDSSIDLRRGALDEGRAC